MDDLKIVVSLENYVETYTEMIEAQMKLRLLRETLAALPEYNWEKVIRVALEIEGGAE